MPTAFDIIKPDQLYQGKTYSDLVSDWFNWFLTSDPEKRTSGPVVFLRSVEIPKPQTKPDGSRTIYDQSVSESFADDPYYPRRYSNTPNVRIGGDKLQIYLDQAVLIPILIAYAEASKPYIDFGLMQDYTGLTIDYGDNPPDQNQCTINGAPVIPNEDMAKYRVSTSVFTAVVPETDFGRSVKDYLEMALTPGHYPTIVEGYFVLVQFKEPDIYFVHSWGSAPRELRGPYFSELLYQIEAQPRPDICKSEKKSQRGSRPPSRGAVPFRPARNESLIVRILTEKLKAGELSEPEIQKMGKYFNVNVTNVKR